MEGIIIFTNNMLTLTMTYPMIHPHIIESSHDAVMDKLNDTKPYKSKDRKHYMKDKIVNTKSYHQKPRHGIKQP